MRLIAVIAEEGEDVKAAAGAAAGKTAAPPAAKPPAAPTPSPASASCRSLPRKLQRQPRRQLRRRRVALPVSKDGGRVFASPLARRLAKDAGVDLARVSGSGPHGRVVARDVEAAKSGKGLAPAAARPAAAAPIAPAMADSQVLALYEPGSYELDSA